VVCLAWAEWIINPYRSKKHRIQKTRPASRDGFLFGKGALRSDDLFSVGTRSSVSVCVQLICGY
jgi:hypothetical protein